jgi:NTE family protein
LDQSTPKLSNYDFVIIGGGIAGVTAVETLRAESAQGSILLLSEESQLPYQRGPLSKAPRSLDVPIEPKLLLTQDEYNKLNIEVCLHSRVCSIDSDKKVIEIEGSKGVGFKHLLIATGANPIRLDIPGADLKNIHYLRTFADAKGIASDAERSRRAVVVGGSFIGLELAAMLHEKGVHVTLLSQERLLNTLHAPQLSDFFTKYFSERGIEVLTGEVPSSFIGVDGVKQVVTNTGRQIDCDMAIIGIGVIPATSFLDGGDIKLGDGVIVDRHLRTNRRNIYAAGDVANFLYPLGNSRQRFEHWDGAVKQGRVAAQNMLGQNHEYDEVPYFNAHIFDLNFSLIGLIHESYERVDRGSLEKGSFATFYLQNDIPKALLSFGKTTEEVRVVEALIKNRVNLKAYKEQLKDPTYSLDHIPSQTIFILQGGGALGAFECGAIKALEELGTRPDIVAGTSIGAFNGAIIAGNPDHASEALEAFWNDLSTISPHSPSEDVRRFVANEQVALFGVNQFFAPRWFSPIFNQSQMPMQWLSLYDNAPAAKLLAKYVDFSKLRNGPIRLLVSAVNVQTSELVFFDSYIDHLTPQHILASGSLPPVFPWTTIEGKHYWDGGIISNSPLEKTIERCGSAGKQVFIIDLFPDKREALPKNIVEVIARRDEIIFSERIRSDIKTSNIILEFRKLVNEMMSEIPLAIAEQIHHQPRYIQMMGEEAPMNITRITRETTKSEVVSDAYDFSKKSIDKLIDSGYAIAKKVLSGN